MALVLVIDVRQASKSRVDWLRFQRKYREHGLMHPPERLVVDELGERLEAESVLALRQLPLFAEVALTKNVK